jgi:CRP-like cAMP-binding protein
MSDEIAGLLGRTALGEGLSRGELGRLAAEGRVRQVPAGELLLREGERRGALLVVLEGEVEVLKGEAGGSAHCLVKLGDDSVLGEIGLLRDAPATASVRTTRESTVFELDRDTFDRLLEAGDMSAYRVSLCIARILASRLERMNEEAVELCAKYEQALAETGETHGHRVAELASFRTRLSEWSF